MIEESSLKGRNLRHDPRACLCVDDETTPFAYVQVEGTVVMSADADHVRSWATRIGGRYMGQELAETYGKINSYDGVRIVRLTRPRMQQSARDGFQAGAPENRRRAR
jgi:hypothetical protein